MSLKIKFNPLSGNFDYVVDTAAIDAHIADATIHFTAASLGFSGLTDNRILRANGSNALQNSLLEIDDSGYLRSTSTNNLQFYSTVPDGASAVGHIFDTTNSIVNTNVKLFSIRNQGVEKVWIGNGKASFGQTNNVTLGYSFGEGNTNNASAFYSTTFGYGNTTTGNGAIAGGLQNTAGLYGVSFGFSNLNSAFFGVGIGGQNNVESAASASVAIGTGNNPKGQYQSLIGSYNTMGGINSVAVGNYLRSTGGQRVLMLGSGVSGENAINSRTNSVSIALGNSFNSFFLENSIHGYMDTPVFSISDSNGSFGPELITNGSFTTDASGWTVPAGMIHSAGTIVKNADGTGALTQTLSNLEIGSVYALQFNVLSNTVPTQGITPSLPGMGITFNKISDQSGIRVEFFVATATSDTLTFTPGNTARLTLDDVSIKKLQSGNLTVANKIYSNINNIYSGLLESQVADGASNIGFTLNTLNSINTTGGKLFDVQNNGNSHFSIENVGSPGNGKTVVQRDTHIAGNEASRIWHQIKNNAGTVKFEIGTTSASPYNTEVRFKDASNTRIGFPVSDPTYFAFINDYTEMWLGNISDPSLYFNFYNGSNVNFGTNSNLQGMNAYVTSLGINGQTSSLNIVPNVTTGLPYNFNFGVNSTGFRLQDNKSIFFGTGNDAQIYHDGVDVIFNPKAVGVGKIQVPGQVRITGDTDSQKPLEVNLLNTQAFTGQAMVQLNGTVGVSDAGIIGINMAIDGSTISQGILLSGSAYTGSEMNNNPTDGYSYKAANNNAVNFDFYNAYTSKNTFAGSFFSAEYSNAASPSGRFLSYTKQTVDKFFVGLDGSLTAYGQINGYNNFFLNNTTGPTTFTIKESTTQAGSSLFKITDTANVNKFIIKADFTMNGVDGTNGAPAFSFVDDTNTGMYRPGADQVALAVGATKGFDLLKTSGGFVTAAIGGNASTLDGFPFLISNQVSTGSTQINSNATATSTGFFKTRYEVDTGGLTRLEVGSYPIANTTDAYSARGIIQTTGTSEGISLISNNFSTNSIRAYVGGVTASNKVLELRANELETYGGVSRKISTITAASTNIDETYHIIFIDSTSNAVTINLPAAASHTGREYVFKVKAYTNTVTIDANGSELIDGNLTQNMSLYDGMHIVCDGSNWFVI